MRITSTTAFLLLSGTITVASAPVSPDEQRAVTLDEVGLRRQAHTAPLPEYPAASLAKKLSGVAVASILVGDDGRAVTVELLEAPDAEIGTAVKTALSQWTFTPFPQATRQGTLTFYFQITGGRGRVLNPQDMPGGPKIAPPTPAPMGTAGPGKPPPPVAPPVNVLSHAPPNEIGADRFRELMKTSRPTVLDVRARDEFARGHHDGAINIPYGELSLRGPIELDRSRPVVIDCSRVESFVCSFAAHVLERTKLAALYAFLP